MPETMAIASLPASGLKAATGSGVLHVTPADPSRIEEAHAILAAQLGTPVQHSVEGASIYAVAGSDAAALDAVAALHAAGIRLTDFAMGQPSLDEMLFSLTGKSRTEDPQ